MGYLIYGKVVKPVHINGKNIEPQAKYAALNYDGVRCAKLSDADDYATREDAQEVIDAAMAKWEERGLADCFAFQIRKVK